MLRTRFLGLGLALLALSAFAGDAGAQARRALIIGIGEYSAAPAPVPGSPEADSPFARRRITNLPNARADAETFAAILMARYGFSRDDILFLSDSVVEPGGSALPSQLATREAILAGIKTFLGGVEPGGTAVFYFVGHGSQIMSSYDARLRGEEDAPLEKDQTLVPFDSLSGARDIWDKERRILFNELLKGGRHLTVIDTCCHSGHGTRGDPSSGVGAIRRDAVLLYPEVPLLDEKPPGDNGAIVLTAASAHQPARFRDKKVWENGKEVFRKRGVFDWHFAEVLRSVSIHESAHRVFLRVQARMRTEQYQEPTFEPFDPGPAWDRPLFGHAPKGVSGGIVLALANVDADAGLVQVEGGHALGLGPGTLLRTLSGVELRIESVVDLTTSVARPVEAGPVDVLPGDLVTVTRWVGQHGSLLRAHLPRALPDAEVRMVESFVRELRDGLGDRWVEDPFEVTPQIVVQLEEAGWVVRRDDAHLPLEQREDARIVLSATPTVVETIAAIDGAGDGPVFVNVPPSASKVEDLREDLSGLAIDFVAADDADYQLIGRLARSGIEVAWCATEVLRGVTPSPLRTTPALSSWSARDSETATALRTLARIRGWLNLLSPAEPLAVDHDDAGPSPTAFPYRLELGGSGVGGRYVRLDGQPLDFRLMSAGEQRGVAARLLYVVGISGSLGYAQVVYTSEQRRLPQASGGTTLIDVVYPESLELVPESGQLATCDGLPALDTFILISSDELIDQRDLTWGGTRDATPRGEVSALSQLLGGLMANTRSSIATPMEWSVSSVQVESTNVFPGPGSYDLALIRENPVAENDFVAEAAGTLGVDLVPQTDMKQRTLTLIREDGSTIAVSAGPDEPSHAEIALQAGERVAVRVEGSIPTPLHGKSRFQLTLAFRAD